MIPVMEFKKTFYPPQLAEKLLELGADPNIGDWVQNTPLHRYVFFILTNIL